METKVQEKYYFKKDLRRGSEELVERLFPGEEAIPERVDKATKRITCILGYRRINSAIKDTPL